MRHLPGAEAIWPLCCLLLLGGRDGAATAAAAGAGPSSWYRSRKDDGDASSSVAPEILLRRRRCRLETNGGGTEGILITPHASEFLEKAHSRRLRHRLRARAWQGQMQRLPFQDNPGTAAGKAKKKEILQVESILV